MADEVKNKDRCKKNKEWRSWKSGDTNYFR